MKRHIGRIAVFSVAMAGACIWACSEDTPTTAAADASTSSSGAPGTSSGDPGTSSGSSGTSSGTSGGPTPLRAKALIRPTSDASTVEGTAEFVENGSVTVVTITITGGGGAPGEHGLHIHENGSCDPVDGGAGLGAGGHWNPADAGHGYPSADPHHAGDLGNITIDAEGKGSSKLTFPATVMHVHDGPRSVVGRSVVYHAEKDDGVSQPVGNAGARPGCGVIQKE